MREMIGSFLSFRLLPVLIAWVCLGSSCREEKTVLPPDAPVIEGTDQVPEPGQVPTPDRISIGNRILIRFSGVPKPPPDYIEIIRQEGTIHPPLLEDPVVAAGKTVGELRDELHELYVPGFYKTLNITVHVENRFFTVAGQVRIPNTYPYIEGMTVMKAIATARGINDFGAGRRIRIQRADGTRLPFDIKEAQKDPSLDIPLHPGDYIYVPRSFF